MTRTSYGGGRRGEAVSSSGRDGAERVAVTDASVFRVWVPVIFEFMIYMRSSTRGGAGSP